jgi:hypothetical protein
MYRPGDVFHAVFAHIGEANRKLFGHVFAHRSADTGLAWLGKALKPRRHINAIAKYVISLHNHIANIDANAKANAPAFINVCIATLHSLLHHDGAAHRVNDRRELDKESIAHGLNDASLVLRDQRINEFPAMSVERGKGSFLINPHKPRIPRHVRGKNRGESPRRPGIWAHVRFLRLGRIPMARQCVAILP